MKLGSVRTPAGPQCVAIVDEEIVDLGETAPDLPRDLQGLLAAGPEALEAARSAIRSGAGRSPLSEAHFLTPIQHPSKFVGVGLNYADHIEETGAPTPDFPVIFAKFPSCVAGPYEDVERPAASDAMDYEGELGFVIGTRCRHVSADRAHEVIAGYVIVNDFSIRDYQMRTPQFTIGKSFDTHGVVGPWIVTGDEIDPHALDLRTMVNDEVRQSSNTSNLIFDCFAQVELLSAVCTLEPGDIVASGTPGGVAIGYSPPRWLVPGDVVRVEIDGIGAISNRIVQEPVPEFLSTRFDAEVAAS